MNLLRVIFQFLSCLLLVSSSCSNTNYLLSVLHEETKALTRAFSLFKNSTGIKVSSCITPWTSNESEDPCLYNPDKTIPSDDKQAAVKWARELQTLILILDESQILKEMCSCTDKASRSLSRKCKVLRRMGGRRSEFSTRYEELLKCLEVPTQSPCKSPVGNEKELLISLETKIMSAEYWSGVICMINVNKGE